MFQVVGTQGYVAKYPTPEVLLSPEVSAKMGFDIAEDNTPLSTLQIETLLNRYAPPFSAQTICMASSSTRAAACLILWMCVWRNACNRACH